MTSSTDSPARARPPLSRERVLAAAIALADEAGVEALTMRKLAGALGVEAMTLYYHVANKDAILAGIADLVFAEIQLPAPGEPWKPALRRTAVSAHDILTRHRWAAGLVLSAPAVLPARVRYMDAILGSLREGGLSPQLTHHAYHALESHIMGFTLWQVGISSGIESLEAALASLLEVINLDDHPHFAEHLEQHRADDDPDEPSEFEFGLDLVLDGLERLQRGG